MFGIFLPLNFNSPYKATSIIDFWRRWHMTLSQFLRDYLYIPLGGNRRGPRAALRQSDDHHAARRPLARRGLDLRGLGRAARRLSLHQSRLEQLRARRSRRALRPLADIAGLILTFLAVVIAWVFFRADNMAIGALRAVEDGRPRPTSPSAAPRSPMPLFIVALCRARLVRAEHAGDHGLRSQEPDGRRKARRVAAAPAVASTPARRCWRSGFSESSSTANSSISGSDDMTAEPKICCSFCARPPRSS